MNETQKCLILYGPTAVGKTDISLELAQEIDAEIINMDVGQFYTPLVVGTAKPAWKTMPVTHHLFDILDDPRNFSVIEYKERVFSLLKDIWSRKKTPIIVGGSGFYLYALFFNFNVPESQENLLIKTDNKELYASSWDYLNALDSKRASSIHKNDRYRLIKALELCEEKNIQPSRNKPKFQPHFVANLVFLDRKRSELYDRINKRVEEMFSDGFLEEVDSLLETPWENFLLQKKLIGYNEIVCYLRKNGLFSLDIVEKLIAQRTRNYAKRQGTFWRYFCKKLSAEKTQSELMPALQVVDMSSQTKTENIREIMKNIKN